MDETQKKFLKELYKVNDKYLEELEHILLSLYHRVIHDDLCLEDIEEIGERFGLDIGEKYDIMLGVMLEMEDNEQEND